MKKQKYSFSSQESRMWVEGLGMDKQPIIGLLFISSLFALSYLLRLWNKKWQHKLPPISPNTSLFDWDFQFISISVLFFFKFSKMEIHWNWVRGQITGNDKNLWAQNFFVRDQSSFFVWTIPTGEIEWFQYCMLEYSTIIRSLGTDVATEDLTTVTTMSMAIFGCEKHFPQSYKLLKSVFEH